MHPDYFVSHKMSVSETCTDSCVEYEQVLYANQEMEVQAVEDLASYDRIFDETGWGLYSRFILGLSAFCLFSEGISSTSIQFILPISTCSFALQETSVIFINIAQSLGMAFGGLILTSASDLFGRKVMLATTLMTIFASCLAAGFTHDVACTIISSFCLGSGLASTINVAKINILESVISSKQTFCILFLDLCNTLGYIILPIVTWQLMPVIRQEVVKKNRVSTFRVMYALSGMLCIFAACATALLQESPRFLLTQRKFETALYSIRHIYCVNKSKHWNSFKVKKEQLQGTINDFGLQTYQPRATWIEHLVMLKNRLISSMHKLVERKYLKNLVLLTCLKMTSFFGLFGIGMWLAKILSDDTNNCTISKNDLLHVENATNACISPEQYIIYNKLLVLFAFIFIGNIIMLIIFKYFDRRKIIVSAFSLAGISSFSMAFGKHSFMIIQAGIFMTCYTMVDSVLNLTILEVFPTALRGTAVSQVQVLGYILNGLLKVFLDMPCQFTFIYVGSVMLASSVLAYFLPEMRGKSLVE